MSSDTNAIVVDRLRQYATRTIDKDLVHPKSLGRISQARIIYRNHNLYVDILPIEKIGSFLMLIFAGIGATCLSGICETYRSN